MYEVRIHLLHEINVQRFDDENDANEAFDVARRHDPSMVTLIHQPSGRILRRVVRKVHTPDIIG